MERSKISDPGRLPVPVRLTEPVTDLYALIATQSYHNIACCPRIEDPEGSYINRVKTPRIQKYSDPGQLIVPVNNLLINSSVIFIWQEKP